MKRARFIIKEKETHKLAYVFFSIKERNEFFQTLEKGKYYTADQYSWTV